MTDANQNSVQVNGSQQIIDYLGAIGASPKNTLSMVNVTEETKWATWVDDVLVHLLPPNIYRTAGESLQAFAYISECSNFTFVQKMAAKYVGGNRHVWSGKDDKEKVRGS